MGIKQDQQRKDKRYKKALKRGGLANLSSSGENFHYQSRSIERSQSGGVIPFCLKKMRRLLRQGKAKIIKEDKRGKKIRLPSGEVIVVSRDLKSEITYIGTS